jgi:hypothetical protein
MACTRDSDCDEVLDDARKGKHPCSTGQTLGCNDNCPFTKNGTDEWGVEKAQKDYNQDGIGDANIDGNGCENGWRISCAAGTFTTSDGDEAVDTFGLVKDMVGLIPGDPGTVIGAGVLGFDVGTLIGQQIIGSPSKTIFNALPSLPVNYARAQVVYAGAPGPPAGPSGRPLTPEAIVGIKIQIAKAAPQQGGSGGPGGSSGVFVRVWELNDPTKVYATYGEAFGPSNRWRKLDAPMVSKSRASRFKPVSLPAGARPQVTLMAVFDEGQTGRNPWCMVTTPLGYISNDDVPQYADSVKQSDPLLAPAMCRQRGAWQSFDSWSAALPSNGVDQDANCPERVKLDDRVCWNGAQCIQTGQACVDNADCPMSGDYCDVGFYHSCEPDGRCAEGKGPCVEENHATVCFGDRRQLCSANDTNACSQGKGPCIPRWQIACAPHWNALATSRSAPSLPGVSSQDEPNNYGCTAGQLTWNRDGSITATNESAQPWASNACRCKDDTQPQTGGYLNVAISESGMSGFVYPQAPGAQTPPLGGPMGQIQNAWLSSDSISLNVLKKPSGKLCPKKRLACGCPAGDVFCSDPVDGW